MPRKEPTLKQKAFVKELVKTRNITKSAKAIYNAKDDANAASIGSKALRIPAVQNYMAQILDDSGLTDTDLSRYLEKIIQASVSKRSLSKANVADGIRGIEMIFRLKDRFPVEKKSIVTKKYSIALKSKSEEELLKLLDNTIQEANKYKKLLSITKKSSIEGSIVK